MPSSSSSSNLPLHLIGTRAFLPALLAYIQNLANPTSLPLDHVIFQSILLCLIAGDKHLILRAPEEDVGLTVKLVVWTLSCIFNLPTHKLKIRNKSSTSTSASTSRSSSSSRNNNVSLNPATDPHTFLRSLFLQSASWGRTSSNSNQTSQDEGYEGSGENVNPNLKLFGHHNQHRRQRSGGPGKHHNHKHKPHHEYSRSRSFPNNLAAAALAHGASAPLPPPVADINTNDIPEFGVPPSILKPQPIYPNRTPHPHHHAYTEPLPVPQPQAPAPSLPPIQTKSISKTPLPVLQLPQALVLSGLEHASDAVHRSLARVLGERRVVLESEGERERTTSSDAEAEAEADGAFVNGRDGDDDESGVAGGGGGGGVWTLPEGFITVYVCPWNARERPNLHKSLLDKFAMSANVFVPQSVRHDFHLLPFVAASAAASPSFSSALPAAAAGGGIGSGGGGSRPFHPNFVSAHAHSNPGTPAPSFAIPLPPIPLSTNNSNTPPIYTKPLPSPSPIHPRPSTHFTTTSSPSNTNNNTFNLNPPPPPPPILPDEVIPPSFIKSLHSALTHRTSISYRMSLYLSDIFSATRHHPRLDAMLLTARAVRDAEELVRAARVVGNDLTGMEVVRREEGLGVGLGLGLEADGEGDDEDDEDETTSFDGHGDRISKEYVKLSGDQSITDQDLDVDVDSNTAHNHPSSSHRTKIPDLDVTEVHVARIVPRVISHRVRLRDGPEDEVLASALFGATFKPQALPLMSTIPVEVEGEKEEREKEKAQSSVKGVLVSILSEV